MSEEKTIRILPHGKVVAFGVKDNVTRDVAGRLSENDVALEKAVKQALQNAGVRGWRLNKQDHRFEVNVNGTFVPVADEDGGILDPITAITGQNGLTPYINQYDNHWYIGAVDTGINATGPKGEKGDPGDTGATGAAGAAGVTPSIGLNGNWYIGETDTGVPAEGQDGKDGADGQGVPTGGTTGQALVKKSNADYDTEWADQSGGGVADGTVNGQLLQWNSTSGAWETVLPTQVTFVVKWRLDKTNHKFQVKTRTGYVLSPSAEPESWSDITDSDGGILDPGEIPTS